MLACPKKSSLACRLDQNGLKGLLAQQGLVAVRATRDDSRTEHATRPPSCRRRRDNRKSPGTLNKRPVA